MRTMISAALAAVLLVGTAASADAGGGCHQPATNGATTTVTLRSNCFAPVVTNVATGDTVRFVNVDEWAHTVTGSGFGWGSPGNLAAGASTSSRFDEPGVYPYVCLLHPGMLGAVVVADDGAATTALAPGIAPPAATTPTPPPDATIAVPGAGSGAVTWPFALGLAALAAIVGLAVGGIAPRRRVGSGKQQVGHLPEVAAN